MYPTAVCNVNSSSNMYAYQTICLYAIAASKWTVHSNYIPGSKIYLTQSVIVVQQQQQCSVSVKEKIKPILCGNCSVYLSILHIDATYGPECKNTQLGREYIGKTKETVAGVLCQAWTSPLPHTPLCDHPKQLPRCYSRQCIKLLQEPRGRRPWSVLFYVRS